MYRIIAVVGTTASGKSDCAVAIARRIGGEVISADSRQVYTGLDIGTGKITKKEMQGVTHHMLDVASPIRTYTVSQYHKRAQKILEKLLAQHKTPIVCGGTGLYIDALLKNIQFPTVPPNATFRKKLEKMETGKLFSLLKKADPKRASHIDQYNRRRLVRALEIAKYLGRSPHMASPADHKLSYPTLFVGLRPPQHVLHKKIHDRLLKRIKSGMMDEIRLLHKRGVSWKRMEDLGLEYRYTAKYLQGKITKQEMIEKLFSEIKKYAKRQMTWFGKNKDIQWFSDSTAATNSIRFQDFL